MRSFIDLRTQTIAAVLSTLITINLCQSAQAQNNAWQGLAAGIVGGLFNQALIENARAEWNKLPEIDRTCISIAGRAEGITAEALIQNGVLPTDPRLSEARRRCDQITKKQFRQNASCQISDTGRTYSSWCDEAYAMSISGDSYRRLTIAEAVTAIDGYQNVLTQLFERADARSRRLQMMKVDASASDVPTVTWSCDRARQRTEVAICNSYELTIMDNMYVDLFKRAQPLDKTGNERKKNDERYRKGIACDGAIDCIYRNQNEGIESLAIFLRSFGVAAVSYEDTLKQRQQIERDKRLAEQERREREAEQVRLAKVQQERQAEMRRQEEQRRLEQARLEAERARAQAEAVRLAAAAEARRKAEEALRKEEEARRVAEEKEKARQANIVQKAATLELSRKSCKPKTSPAGFFAGLTGKSTAIQAASDPNITLLKAYETAIPHAISGKNDDVTEAIFKRTIAEVVRWRAEPTKFSKSDFVQIVHRLNNECLFELMDYVAAKGIKFLSTEAKVLLDIEASSDADKLIVEILKVANPSHLQKSLKDGDQFALSARYVVEEMKQLAERQPLEKEADQSKQVQKAEANRGEAAQIMKAKDTKDILFKKGVLWSSKQVQSGKCSDIVRGSNSPTVESFTGFSPEKIVFYYAFTKSTQQWFRSDFGIANKHISNPATYLYNQDSVEIKYKNSNNFNLTSTYRVDAASDKITETEIQCSGNNQACEKSASQKRIALASQIPKYACIDDLPDRDMFSGSPIDRLRSSTGDVYYQAFECYAQPSEENTAYIFAVSLMKYLKEGNQTAYDAEIRRSKQGTKSIDFLGEKIELGACSKMELSKATAPPGTKQIVDSDQNLDFTIYRNSAAIVIFNGIVERRR
jgi:hypothetical protein